MASSIGLMHFEEEGGNCYTNVYDNPLSPFMTSYINMAVDNMGFRDSDITSCTIVDYGTADGGFFLRTLPVIIETIRNRYGQDKEMMVQFVDIPCNDFKSVWNNVYKLKSLSHTYFASSAGSFHNQCFPKNSIHLGMTTSATHWLSDSDFVLPGSIWPNACSDPQFRRSVDELSNQDWENFLLHRSEELVTGGVLLCCNYGFEKEAKNSVWMESEIKPLDKAWRQLCDKGLISQVEFERCGISYLFRSEDQHKKPFTNKDSLVSKAGMRLLYFKSKSLTFLQNYRETLHGKITPDNEQKILEIIAQKRTDLIKVIYTPHVIKSLHRDRAESERQVIVQSFLDGYKKLIQQNQTWLSFPDDVHYHIMIIKKVEACP